MSIRVYFEQEANFVFIEQSQVEDSPLNSLFALQLPSDSANNLSILSLTKSVIDTNTYFYEMENIVYTEFVDQDDNAAGATVQETIDYLNGVFQQAPTAGAPVITSPTTAAGYEGNTFQYLIEATNDPTWFDASGLPANLFCNQVSGEIQGTLASGTAAGSPYAVSVGVMNSLGSDQQNVTLTVTTPPAFLNVLSTIFRRFIPNAVDMGTGTTLYRTPAQAFTYSIWFKRRGNPDGTLVSISDTAGLGFTIAKVSNQIRVTLQSDNGKLEFTGGTTLTNNTWYHVCFTYDGTTSITGATLYLDAVAETKNSTTDTLSGSFASTGNSKFVLGTSPTLPFGSNWLRGRMDEVSVFSDELTSLEVTAIYNSGSPKDLSTEAFFSDCISWWRMGDGDSIPTIKDQASSNDGTTFGMTAANFVNDVP